jgi:hypothetical protein
MISLNSPPEETLYRRLGGYDVITAVIDEFLSRFGSAPGWRGSAGGEVWIPASGPVSCWSTKSARSPEARVCTLAGT